MLLAFTGNRYASLVCRICAPRRRSRRRDDRRDRAAPSARPAPRAPVAPRRCAPSSQLACACSASRSRPAVAACRPIAPISAPPRAPHRPGPRVAALIAPAAPGGGRPKLQGQEQATSMAQGRKTRKGVSPNETNRILPKAGAVTPKKTRAMLPAS
jgi:hypothetical protein